MNCRLCGKPGHQEPSLEWRHDEGEPIYHVFRPDIARKAVEASPDLPPALERCHRCGCWIGLDEGTDWTNGYAYHRSQSLCDEKLDMRERDVLNDADTWTPEAAL